jgi:hypothetical protein
MGRPLRRPVPTRLCGGCSTRRVTRTRRSRPPTGTRAMIRRGTGSTLTTRSAHAGGGMRTCGRLECRVATFRELELRAEALSRHGHRGALEGRSGDAWRSRRRWFAWKAGARACLVTSAAFVQGERGGSAEPRARCLTNAGVVWLVRTRRRDIADRVCDRLRRRGAYLAAPGVRSRLARGPRRENPP